MHERLAVRSPIRGAFCATPDTPTTISWRPGSENFIAALPWNHPIDQGAFLPLWNPDQPCEDRMCYSSTLDHIAGTSRFDTVLSHNIFRQNSVRVITPSGDAMKGRNPCHAMLVTATNYCINFCNQRVIRGRHRGGKDSKLNSETYVMRWLQKHVAQK